MYSFDEIVNSDIFGWPGNRIFFKESSESPFFKILFSLSVLVPTIGDKSFTLSSLNGYSLMLTCLRDLPDAYFLNIYSFSLPWLSVTSLLFGSPGDW